MEDLSLAKLDEVRLALEKATTVQEVKQVRDMAVAAAVYAQQQKLGKEIQLQMDEYIKRAERKLGEMLRAAKAGGKITTQHHYPKNVVPLGNNDPIKLSDIGIDRKLSSRAQKLAAMPEKDFEEQIIEQKKVGPPKPRKHQYSEAEVIALYRQGVRQNEIAEKTGVDFRRVSEIVLGEKIHQDRAAEISPEMLKLSDRKKVERAIAQQLKKLEQEYTAKVMAAGWQYLEIRAAEWRKEQEQAKKVMSARQGFMTRLTYRKILACLHPDWVTDPKQKARYEEAFREFGKLEKFLLNEKESPTMYTDIPKTRAEWEELKRRTAAERKAKRSARTPAKQ